MASAWITRRRTNDGIRHRVMFRVGGRESSPRYGGSFATQREAKLRKDFITGELAALRVPALRLLVPEPASTLAVIAERWRSSRVDVADGTAATHRVNLNRIIGVLGERPIDEIKPDEIAEFVVGLSGLKRETIRKTVATLAMVFDFHGVSPNPARDKRVRLPQEDKIEVNPPTAPHVVAVHRLLPRAYRLLLLVLDATGMRVGELESLVWGDVDEQEGRWRVSQAKAKTKSARWVPVTEVVFQAVTDTVPREDRYRAALVFPGCGADRLRTGITRACKAAGVPTFSPHDLRHRRATLWHLQGVPAVEAASWLGHSAQEHLRTYAHVVVDSAELDYPDLLAQASDPPGLAGVVRGT
jgi:integrase